jgi:uncharacterized protein YycO
MIKTQFKDKSNNEVGKPYNYNMIDSILPAASIAR